MTTYREVLVSDVGFWMAHVRLAELFETLKQWGEALHERHQALVLNPADPMLQVDLGVTMARSGRAGEADSVLALQAALPRMALIPYHRGELAWLRNDPQTARTAYETFLALAPARLVGEIADAQVRLEVLRHQSP